MGLLFGKYCKVGAVDVVWQVKLLLAMQTFNTLVLSSPAALLLAQFLLVAS